jgi:hypothetical protein
MTRDFEFRLADMENILHEMEQRGHVYFDETMRLARLFDLVNKDRIQRGFREQVGADAPQALEHKVTELIDWLVNSDLNQWQAVMRYLDQRRQEYAERLVGEVGGTFRYDRDHFIDSVGKAAQQVVETYDTADEARKMADSAQKAVAETALTEIGAVGLGAVVVALATTLAVDITGIVAASVMALLGLAVIPARRQSAKRDMVARVAALREQLMGALTAQFEKELSRSLQRINDAVTPYTRFVRAERTKLEQTKGELAQAQQTQGRLRAEIEEQIADSRQYVPR